MALTLCPNCRLPVHESAHRCTQCSADLTSGVSTAVTRGVPVAAAVALVATLAVLARRRA